MMPIKFLSKCKNNYSDIPASCERETRRRRIGNTPILHYLRKITTKWLSAIKGKSYGSLQLCVKM
jgi:hypothetical protein